MGRRSLKHLINDHTNDLFGYQAAEREREQREAEQRAYLRAEKHRREAEIREQERLFAEAKQRQRNLQQREEENRRLAKARETSSAMLRQLRELIRMRYALDIEIWNLRNVRTIDRDLVVQKGRKADAVLADIYKIVDAWNDESWGGKGTAEAKAAREIQAHFAAGGPRVWQGNPPWREEEMVGEQDQWDLDEGF